MVKSFFPKFMSRLIPRHLNKSSTRKSKPRKRERRREEMKKVKTRSLKSSWDLLSQKMN